MRSIDPASVLTDKFDKYGNGLSGAYADADADVDADAYVNVNVICMALSNVPDALELGILRHERDNNDYYYCIL